MQWTPAPAQFPARLPEAGKIVKIVKIHTQTELGLEQPKMAPEDDKKEGYCFVAETSQTSPGQGYDRLDAYPESR